MNAGVTTQQPVFADSTDEQYFRILNINVNGVVFGVREAIRAMTPGGGSILATASLAGLVAYAGDPIYALTKHAVVGLVRGLGLQLRDSGITRQRDLSRASPRRRSSASRRSRCSRTRTSR